MTTTFTSNQIKVEINRIVAKAKETNVLVTDVPALDDSGTNVVSVEVLREIVAGVSEKVVTTTFMIIVAGDVKCQAIVYKAPESQVNVSDWLLEIGMIMVGVSGDYAELVCDNNSSLKKKDELTANAFAFLRKHKLLNDHDSDDELPIFDW